MWLRKVDLRVFDSNVELPVKEPLLSNIEILCSVTIITDKLGNKEDILFVAMQTSLTSDAGAISTRLKLHRDVDSLKEYKSFQIDALERFILQNGAQKVWDEYVKDNYSAPIKFEGIDANSFEDSVEYV
jgi:hypothetical protein